MSPGLGWLQLRRPWLHFIVGCGAVSLLIVTLASRIGRPAMTLLFPECLAKGSRLIVGSGVERCSRRVVSASATVRKERVSDENVTCQMRVK